MFRYSLFLKGKFIHFSFHHLFERYQKSWFSLDFGVKISRQNLEMRLFGLLSNTVVMTLNIFSRKRWMVLSR